MFFHMSWFARSQWWLTKCCNNVFTYHTSLYARFCMLCTTYQHKDNTETHDPPREVGTTFRHGFTSCARTIPFWVAMWHNDGNHVICDSPIHLNAWHVYIYILNSNTCIDLSYHPPLWVQITLSSKSRGGAIYDSLSCWQADGVIADYILEHHKLLLAIHIFHWHAPFLHFTKRYWFCGLCGNVHWIVGVGVCFLFVHALDEFLTMIVMWHTR